MKKTIPILFTGALLLLMSSCVGDPYYEQLNSAPTIKLSSLTDTIKVSPAAFTNQVSEIVTCYDYNMNMRTLTLTSSDQANIQIFDDKEAALSKTQIGNNVETLNQKVVFKAQTMHLLHRQQQS